MLTVLPEWVGACGAFVRVAIVAWVMTWHLLIEPSCGEFSRVSVRWEAIWCVQTYQHFFRSFFFNPAGDKNFVVVMTVSHSNRIESLLNDVLLSRFHRRGS